MDMQQIVQLIENMTLEEKLGMIHGQGIFHTKGVERLGIPPLWMSDGPMGVRRELQDDNWSPKGTTDDYVSYLPSNSAIACTWSRERAGEMGRVLGEEARARGKDVILAPGINLIRSPLCGRNFEYMSEDPHLIAQMAVPLIRGIEECDTAACVKHFALNNQETRRLDVDVIVGDRALRELYLPGFEAAVKEGRTKTLMGAYNRFGNEHCCHNRYLLQDILRGEWDYDGAVISDWGGVHDTMQAAEHGLDIEMSVTNNFDEYYMADPLLEKVHAGEVKESLIDEKVRHILVLMNRLHMLDGTRKRGAYNTRAHQDAILACASEAVVLLKNEEGLLPLKLGESETEIKAEAKQKHLAVIGENAEKVHSNGGGSAAIKALYEFSPLMGLKMELGGSVEVEYAPGYRSDEKKSSEKENWQAASLEARAYKKAYGKDSSEDEEKRRALREEAVRLAKSCESVVLFCGLNHEFDLEGCDRRDMKLPYGQEELILSVLEANQNTVIVVIAGSPVDMEAFADRAKAIVYSSYNGMEGGLAIAKVLLGSTNPSGHLPFTIPKHVEDCPAHRYGEFPGDDTVTYREGIYVGYRHYETEKIDVRYSFGHGLSYTEFSYSELKIQETQAGFTGFVKIRNCGRTAGAEVVQIYVDAAGKTVERPARELRGFQKIFLQPGEEGSVEFTLPWKSFSYFNEISQIFEVPEDEYKVCVGRSVSDIRLSKSVVPVIGSV